MSLHISAKTGEIADFVLMPGDPLRAKYIAETFFADARLVTDVRNVYGFTGAYRDLPVSVMAHGMGIPSASIYFSELMGHYDIKRIIRVGSCGTSHPDVSLRDIVIAIDPGHELVDQGFTLAQIKRLLEQESEAEDRPLLEALVDQAPMLPNTGPRRTSHRGGDTTTPAPPGSLG